jgi:small subunit ribosomal protein S12
MITGSQLFRKPRFGSKHRSTIRPALLGSPHKKGVVMAVTLMSPRKPNSARRRIARIKIRMGRTYYAYRPGGEPHQLQQYSEVLVRGGRTKDLPGLKYKLMRGHLDFRAPDNRMKQRSRFGIKRMSVPSSFFPDEL